MTKLRCAEGLLPAWEIALFARLDGLRVLNLSGCGLAALPAGGDVLPLNLRHARRAKSLNANPK